MRSSAEKKIRTLWIDPSGRTSTAEVPHSQFNGSDKINPTCKTNDYRGNRIDGRYNYYEANHPPSDHKSNLTLIFRIKNSLYKIRTIKFCSFINYAATIRVWLVKCGGKGRLYSCSSTDMAIVLVST